MKPGFSCTSYSGHKYLLSEQYRTREIIYANDNPNVCCKKTVKKHCAVKKTFQNCDGIFLTSFQFHR